MKSIKTALVTFCILIPLWYGAFLLTGGIGIPSPLITFKTFLFDLPNLLTHVSVSLLRIGTANILCIIIGTIIGLIIAQSSRLYSVLSPVIFAMLPIPKIAFLPLFMVLFGINEWARIGLLIFMLVFQYIIAAIDAFSARDTNQNMIIKSLNLKPWVKLVRIDIPYYLPFLFTVIRQALGISIAVLFSIETFINQLGIGYYIMNRWSSLNYPEMYAGIIAISLVGVILYQLIDRLETVLIPWKQKK